MSAIITLKRRDSICLMTDAVSYDNDGIVRMVSQKVVAFPLLNMAMATLGPASAGYIFGLAITEAFDSFDDVAAGIEDLTRDVFQESVAAFAGASRFGGCELVLAGWSAERGRVEAFQISMWDDGGKSYWHGRGDNVHIEPFVLTAMPVLGGNPGLPLEEMKRTGFPLNFSSPEEAAEALVPQIDLLHLLELQRQQRGADGIYWVGGAALLTIVNKDSITQQCVHRWSEDQVGALISPTPIVNWRRWRAERKAPGSGESAAVVLAMQKRARKMASRVPANQHQS